MVRRGDQVYSDINGSVREAQDGLDRAALEMKRLQSQLEQAHGSEARELANLARVRFEELAADRVAGGLDAADRRALEILAQRQADLDGLLAAVTASKPAVSAGQFASLLGRFSKQDAETDSDQIQFNDETDAPPPNPGLLARLRMMTSRTNA